MNPLVFPTERISKRRTGDIGNVEHLQRIIQDSFNKFNTLYNSKMVFKMAAKTKKKIQISKPSYPLKKKRENVYKGNIGNISIF